MELAWIGHAFANISPIVKYLANDDVLLMWIGLEATIQVDKVGETTTNTRSIALPTPV